MEIQAKRGARIVYEGDALEWLAGRGVLDGASVVTSLPDFSEFPNFSLDEWKAWFLGAVVRVLQSIPENGVAIFYQTDRKRDGEWINKSYLCQQAAGSVGHKLLWHKVVCRAPAGNITFGNPSYSHMLCFSKGVLAAVKNSSADVLPAAGFTTWTRGMGTLACQAACNFILKNTETRTIVDPFCGHGTVLAVANDLGLDSVGVEISRKRARQARALSIPNL